MEKITILAETVKKYLEQQSCGHDFYHVERVAKLAEIISQKYPVAINRTILLATAYVHDICRPFEKLTGKSHFGDEALKKIKNILIDSNFDKSEILDIIYLVKYHDVYDISQIPKLTHELMVHQDADRLDAIGAIGIARTFAFGGANNLSIYNPGENLEFNNHFVEDPNHRTSTIAHFYEKLLKLKNQMHTVPGRKIAEQRHNLMLNYLENFFAEWNIKVTS